MKGIKFTTMRASLKNEWHRARGTSVLHKIPEGVMRKLNYIHEQHGSKNVDILDQATCIEVLTPISLSSVKPFPDSEENRPEAISIETCRKELLKQF